MMAWRAKWHERNEGVFAGLFLTGYGTARFIVEYFREPDSHIGLYEFMSLSHGQLLSLPMIVLGGIIMARILKSKRCNMTELAKKLHDMIAKAALLVSQIICKSV